MHIVWLSNFSPIKDMKLQVPLPPAIFLSSPRGTDTGESADIMFWEHDMVWYIR